LLHKIIFQTFWIDADLECTKDGYSLNELYAKIQ